MSRSRFSSKRSGSGDLSMTLPNNAAKRVANTRSLTAVAHNLDARRALRFDEIRHDGRVKIEHLPLTGPGAQGACRRAFRLGSP